MSSSRRLGRAVLRLLQHESAISDPVVRARLDNLLLVARSMDYAARLREFGPADVIGLEASGLARAEAFRAIEVAARESWPAWEFGL